MSRSPDPLISVVVPTLNEQRYLPKLLRSLKKQDYHNYEVIVVDGGSRDGTAEIARSNGATLVVRPGLGEFQSRNVGSDLARGEVILHTGADAVFPRGVLGRIGSRFAADASLLAVSGPGVPVDPPPLVGIEYGFYNFCRWAFSRLPGHLKRFSTSTYLLAIQKEEFAKVGGFTDDFNADGIMGRALCGRGMVEFSLHSIRVGISPRRFEKMGFAKANTHFLYVVENFIPALGKTKWLADAKWSSVRYRVSESETVPAG